MSAARAVAAFGAVLRRDLRVAWRRGAELWQPALFFVIVSSLFPLALGMDAAVLGRLAPGILWVAALLATLLALEALFRSDLEDGTLELLLLSPFPPALLTLAKVLAQWLTTSLPLVLTAPLLAAALHLPMAALPALLASLLLGTPVLSLVGAIGVALTVGLRQGGVLIALLVLPLYTPVLIFATSAVDLAAAQLSPAAPLYLLAALLVLALTLAPMAVAAALRAGIDS